MTPLDVADWRRTVFALYEAVRSLDWARYLTPDHTLAVDCNVRDSHITHSRYAALRTKDAICDQFVERCQRIIFEGPFEVEITRLEQ